MNKKILISTVITLIYSFLFSLVASQFRWIPIFYRNPNQLIMLFPFLFGSILVGVTSTRSHKMYSIENAVAVAYFWLVYEAFKYYSFIDANLGLSWWSRFKDVIESVGLYSFSVVMPMFFFMINGFYQYALRKCLAYQTKTE